MTTQARRSLSVSALLALLAVPASAATFQWQRTNKPADEGVAFSGQWEDPAMWTVSGTDDDGIPDADDNVVFGTQKSGSGMLVPTFSGPAACNRMELKLRTDSYVAFTMKFKNGSLCLGAGGLSIHEGNEWQDASAFESSFAVELAADQVWEHKDSNFYVRGPVTGDYTITLKGSSRPIYFNNSNNTFDGIVNESGITRFEAASVVQDGVLVSGPFGVGTVVLKGGTFSSNSGNATGQTLYNALEIAGSSVILGNSKDTFFSDACTNACVLSADEAGAVRELSIGKNVTITRTITESGATGIRLRKTGTGKLTLNGAEANTFAGGVEVANGQLVAAKNGACGSGDVLVTRSAADSTAALRIQAGVTDAISDNAALRLAGFAGETTNYPVVTLDGGVVEQVKELSLDGVPQADGFSYGGPDSPADVVLADWFAGSGVVRVARPATVFIVQ